MILKFLVNTLKLCAFAAAVLVASHLIRWHGVTISDQVKTTLSSEEPQSWMKQAKTTTRHATNVVKTKAAEIADDADESVTEKIRDAVARAPEQARSWIQAQKESADSSMNPRSQEETISDHEKNELDSLIEN